MTAGVRQAALVALALAVLAFMVSALHETEPPAPPIGDAAPTPPGSGAEAAALTQATLAFTDAPTSTTSAGPATTESVATTLAPRSVTVTVHPGGSGAVVTASVDGVEVASGPSPLEMTAAGPVAVTVSTDGYRAEELTIPTDRSGQVEVWVDPPDQVVDRVRAFATGDAPKQVAFTPDGEEVWVTLLGGTGLEVYDTDDGTRVAAVDLPEAGSVEVIFGRSGERAYVSQMETASVYEIDTGSYEVVRRFGTGGSWTKMMLLSPDETTLWASNWVSNDVSEIDLATGEVLRRIPTVTTPRGLAVDGDGSTLYVAGYEHGQLQAVDLATGEGTILYESGGAMRHLVADHERGLVYASDMATDQLLVVDMTDNEVTELAVSDRLPNSIDLSPDGRVLAVSNRGRNNPESYYLPGPEWGTVLLFDTTTGDLLDAVVGGNQPTGLDVSSDGRLLAYSDFLDDRVTIVEIPATAELVAGGGGRADTYRAEVTK